MGKIKIAWEVVSGAGKSRFSVLGHLLFPVQVTCTALNFEFLKVVVLWPFVEEFGEAVPYETKREGRSEIVRVLDYICDDHGRDC